MKKIFLLFTLSFYSCKIDYDYFLQSSENKKSVDKPDIIAYDFDMKMVKNGFLKAKTKSDKTLVYSKKELQEFEKFYFQTFNEEGKLESRGYSKTATAYTNKEDIELFDNVNIYSVKEKANLKSKYLKWLNKQRYIYGNEIDKVFITKENGDNVSGKSFSFDARKQIMIFQKEVKGKFEDKKDEESKQTEKDKK